MYFDMDLQMFLSISKVLTLNTRLLHRVGVDLMTAGGTAFAISLALALPRSPTFLLPLHPFLDSVTYCTLLSNFWQIATE